MLRLISVVLVAATIISGAVLLHRLSQGAKPQHWEIQAIFNRCQTTEDVLREFGPPDLSYSDTRTGYEIWVYYNHTYNFRSPEGLCASVMWFERGKPHGVCSDSRNTEIKIPRPRPNRKEIPMMTHRLSGAVAWKCQAHRAVAG